ncbi:MAG: hypothetical protein KKA41_14150 [Proteobacteria bacterium]|nr:hypothetical protein [Pseudomonadota bacterium]
MTEELEIPENLLSTYRRLIKKAPSEQKEDVEFQKKILIYLKSQRRLIYCQKMGFWSGVIL